jgi:hypothetical protein
MKKAWIAGFLMVGSLSLVCALSTFAAAEDKSAEKPGAKISDSAEMVMTVKSLDVKKRVAVFVDANGNTMVLNVKPDVKNLDRVKVGDNFRVKYTQTVSIHVRAAQSGAAASASTSTEVNPAGMPNKTVTNQAEFVAKIVAIDYNKRMVTLLGPQGKEETHEISKEVKDIKKIKVGDEVVVTVTETLAGAIEPVEKK